MKSPVINPPKPQVDCDSYSFVVMLASKITSNTPWRREAKPHALKFGPKNGPSPRPARRTDYEITMTNMRRTRNRAQASVKHCPPQLPQAIAEARELGDLKENCGITMPARVTAGQVEARIPRYRVVSNAHVSSVLCAHRQNVFLATT